MLHWFCSEFYTLSSSAKILKIGRFDKVTESLQVGPFFETQCSFLGAKICGPQFRGSPRRVC